MPTLPVPGATLHYETFGSAGPLILLIPGANGTGNIFHTLAQHLAGRATVVCYDRRGYSRSHLVGKQDFERRLQTDADDAARLIGHLSPDGTAAVFGSSSGAIVALELLVRHPGCVSTLVAHEPPSFSVLPEDLRAQATGLISGIYETYRAHGPETAMELFTSSLSNGQEGELMRRAMDVTRHDTRANCLFWFEFELRQYTRATVYLEALAGGKEKLVLVAGEESLGPGLGPVGIIAKEVGREVKRVVGGHLGYVTAPEAFAEVLFELLGL